MFHTLHTFMLEMGATAVGSGTATAPSIAFADGADGTATVTVSSSTTGSTNTAYILDVDNVFDAGTWASAGSRTGDGAITISPGAGLYFVYVLSTINSTSAISSILYKKITDGTEAIWEQCLDAVQATIRLLTLTGIESADIIRQPRYTDIKGNALPKIYVVPYPREKDYPLFWSNRRDGRVYPVAVVMVEAGNRNNSLDTGPYLQWRQKIDQAFSNQPLQGADDVHTCEVEYFDAVEAGFWADNILGGALLINCIAQQTRGLS